jgi:hypothetical protein
VPAGGEISIGCNGGGGTGDVCALLPVCLKCVGNEENVVYWPAQSEQVALEVEAVVEQPRGGDGRRELSLPPRNPKL